MSAEADPAAPRARDARQSNRARAFHRFRHASLAVLGVTIIALLAIAVAFGPMIAPYPDHIWGATDTAARFQPPSLQHLFGTNDLGQDVFSLVLGGARVTLLAALAVTVIGAASGTILGAISGYFGGLVDEVIMRLTDLMLILPSLILAMVIGAALGAGLGNLVIAIAVSWWPSYARLVRGEVLGRREELYVLAVRAQGASHARVLFRHILPNIASVIIVRMSIDVGYAILMIASLGFIGIGIKPPTPEWGLLLSLARLNMPDFWWTALFPGLAIFLAVFGFNILGEALRSSFDPRGTR